jgi:hypothetical protein
MSKVRGVRFSLEDDALIEEFLLKNRMMDFSMLAKVAILKFIKHPEIALTPVARIPQKENKNARPN